MSQEPEPLKKLNQVYRKAVEQWNNKNRSVRLDTLSCDIDRMEKMYKDPCLSDKSLRQRLDNPVYIMIDRKRVFGMNRMLSLSSVKGQPSSHLYFVWVTMLWIHKKGSRISKPVSQWRPFEEALAISVISESLEFAPGPIEFGTQPYVAFGQKYLMEDEIQELYVHHPEYEQKEVKPKKENSDGSGK